MTTATMNKTVFESEYKGKFKTYDIGTEKEPQVVIMDDDENYIDTDVVYDLLHDQCVRHKNEASVIRACLENGYYGHKFLADGMTRFAHNVQDWSHPVIKLWRAKIYKYSKAKWTIKKSGGKKNPHFYVAAVTPQANPKPKKETKSTQTPVATEAATPINDRPAPMPAIKLPLEPTLHSLVDEYGIEEVTKMLASFAKQQIAQANPTKTAQISVGK